MYNPYYENLNRDSWASTLPFELKIKLFFPRKWRIIKKGDDYGKIIFSEPLKLPIPTIPRFRIFISYLFI